MEKILNGMLVDNWNISNRQGSGDGFLKKIGNKDLIKLKQRNEN